MLDSSIQGSKLKGVELEDFTLFLLALTTVQQDIETNESTSFIISMSHYIVAPSLYSILPYAKRLYVCSLVYAQQFVCSQNCLKTVLHGNL